MFLVIWAKRLLLFIFVLCLAYWALIEYPSVLFPHKHTKANIEFYSDKPFPLEIDNLSQQIFDRVSKAELYNEERIYKVYMTMDEWRWSLISFPVNQGNAGAFATLSFSHNAFMRPSIIAENRIIPPGSGLADEHVRDLVYFVSHEIGHVMMMDHLGIWQHSFNTPFWLQEGYPDYIAKAHFDFSDNLKQYKQNEWRLTNESGLYVRHHLFVAWLIDQNDLTIKDILRDTPEGESIEIALQQGD